MAKKKEKKGKKGKKGKTSDAACAERLAEARNLLLRTTGGDATHVGHQIDALEAFIDAKLDSKR